MKGRYVSFACALLGVATLGLVIAFSQLPEARAMASAGCGDQQTLVHFQLSHNLRELMGVLHAGDSACRAKTLSAMDALNRLDLFAFIPTYAAFLIAGALLLARGARGRLAFIAIGAALLAAGADIMETCLQLHITPSLETSADLVRLVRLSASLKYGLLALNGALMGLMAWAPARRIGPIALLGFAPTPFFLWTLVDSSRAQLMSLAFAALWIALLCTAIWMLMRGRQSQ